MRRYIRNVQAADVCRDVCLLFQPLWLRRLGNRVRHRFADSSPRDAQLQRSVVTRRATCIACIFPHSPLGQRSPDRWEDSENLLQATSSRWKAFARFNANCCFYTLKRHALPAGRRHHHCASVPQASRRCPHSFVCRLARGSGGKAPPSFPLRRTRKQVPSGAAAADKLAGTFAFYAACPKLNQATFQQSSVYR